jgi:large subunit ribosomal protein L37Ae
MVKTKLAKAAGRYGVRYGQSIRRRIAAIEEKQRQKQNCIFCNGVVKRLSKGIWECKRCSKKFAGHAYYLEKDQSAQEKFAAEKKSKSLKKEKTINK